MLQFLLSKTFIIDEDMVLLDEKVYKCNLSKKYLTKKQVIFIIKIRKMLRLKSFVSKYGSPFSDLYNTLSPVDENNFDEFVRIPFYDEINSEQFLELGGFAQEAIFPPRYQVKTDKKIGKYLSFQMKYILEEREKLGKVSKCTIEVGDYVESNDIKSSQFVNDCNKVNTKYKLFFFF